MFDAETIALMQGAPQLEGLDLGRLPQQLTEAYATIVALRIRMSSGPGDLVIPEELTQTLQKLKRLALTNEALVAALPNREDRAAAAFVAASAHHATLLALSVAGPTTEHTLGWSSIPPAVAATLLFTIAESNADAAEMSKSIDIPTDGSNEAVLLKNLVALARGRLAEIVDIPSGESSPNQSLPLSEQAQAALYGHINKGVVQLSAELLGQSLAPASLETFQRVRSLSFDTFALERNPEEQTAADQGGYGISVFPGPYHLASLMIAVASDLAESAIVQVPPPAGVDGSRWRNLTHGIAVHRPLLWRNHRQAISSGYLEIGRSAAISFPTGAGKSTLSELKIATHLLAGRKVVFLAPTLALVDQTASALTKTFSSTDIQSEASTTAFDDVSSALPSISVMTPERCLALLGFNGEAFQEVGLLVFDECHLLHPVDLAHSRRAIDSTLCLLNFVQFSPAADILLLSAMMKNTAEISAWVQEMTGRPCIPLSLTWKPTRQVRGCVVYDVDRINELSSSLQAERRAHRSRRSPPAAFKRSLTAIPSGFFCLDQTWLSSSRAHYSYLQLLEQPIQLGTGSSRNGAWWYLTPNGNEVAAKLAVATAMQGLKTLVFAQSVKFANSITKSVNQQFGEREIQLNDEESALLRTISEELGDIAHSYIELRANGSISCACVCHHGALLPAERLLHESLFRRANGANVMVATSTLAQGMNLPSEVVIIAGDSRFDTAADRVQQLQAHELLNAAGRAGRAGEASYGFVLIVPSKVVHFSNGESRIHNHWSDLQSIFSQSDQCVDIDDPLTELLDRVHSNSTDETGLVNYFVARLPMAANDGSNEAGERVLSRSFAAFRARREGRGEWLATRIAASLAARGRMAQPNIEPWVERLASSSGAPAEFIQALGSVLSPINFPHPMGVIEWRDWYLQCLQRLPQFVPQMIRTSTLEDLLGQPYKDLQTNEERGNYAMHAWRPLLTLWMEGRTLAEMEAAMGTTNLGKCPNARDFVISAVPEIAYMFGLPFQIVRALLKERGQAETLVGLGLQNLASCIRQGYDHADKLALHIVLKRQRSRVVVTRQYNRMRSHIQPAAAAESQGMALERVRNAMRTFLSSL